MDLQVDPADACLLLGVAFAAGWLDAVVGGGGLVQVPALLLLVPSAPVATVLGTNKMVAITGTSGAAVTYARQVGLDKPRALAAAALGVPCALAGAVTASRLPRDVIVAVVVATLLGVGTWAALAHPAGGRRSGAPQSVPAGPSWRPTLLLGGGACVVGFYSGAVGSGTGVLLLALFVTGLGTDFLRGSAMAKAVSLGSDLGALVLFGALGHVLWSLGGGMAAANVLGGVVGARTALARGAGFVRGMLLVVVVALVGKLTYDQWIAA